MKVYVDPISTTSRALLLFLAEHGNSAEIVPVRLFPGEHLTSQYAAINPNQCVPALQDGDFTLCESSAILKYLAEKLDSPTYPRDLQQRARVNERMDWLNTGLYRDFGYGVVYQQIFPKFRFDNPATQAQVLAQAKERAPKWLAILNDHHLNGREYLCGDQLTIADYLGATYLSIADWVSYDLAQYPNVTAWLERTTAPPSWQQTHDEWNGLVAHLQQENLRSA